MQSLKTVVEEVEFSFAHVSDCLPLLLVCPEGARFWGFCRRRHAVVNAVKAFSAHRASVVLWQEKKNTCKCASGKPGKLSEVC